MSSFLKSSKRKANKLEKKKVQNHIKAMYRIMDEVKETAKDIHNSKLKWNEDNIIDIAAKFTDIEIGPMEKFLLMGNIKALEDEVEDGNSD